MVPRWLIVLPAIPGDPVLHQDFFYMGKGGDKNVWSGKRNSATKFVTKAQAESFALLITIEQPEIIGKVEVVPYEEVQVEEGRVSPSVDGRQAGR